MNSFDIGESYEKLTNWAWREDKALLALFKLLGSQIHNLDPM